MRTSVRLDGVDTPEIRGKCQEEKTLAIQARDFVRARVGTTVKLYQIRAALLDLSDIQFKDDPVN